MNETLFTSLAQAPRRAGCWRADYNDTRPHSQLGLDKTRGQVIQFSLQVAANVTFEQTQTIMGRAGSVCLLNNQLSAFVEPLESTSCSRCGRAFAPVPAVRWTFLTADYLVSAYFLGTGFQ